MAENERKLPKFTSEQEEAEFWDTHDSTEFLAETELVETTFVDARSTKQQKTLREQLIAGYQANAAVDIELAADWAPIEDEV